MKLYGRLILKKYMTSLSILITHVHTDNANKDNKFSSSTLNHRNKKYLKMLCF